MATRPDRDFEAEVYCPSCGDTKFSIYRVPAKEEGTWTHEREFTGERVDTKVCKCGCVLERKPVKPRDAVAH